LETEQKLHSPEADSSGMEIPTHGVENPRHSQLCAHWAHNLRMSKSLAERREWADSPLVALSFDKTTSTPCLRIHSPLGLVERPHSMHHDTAPWMLTAC
jgi:hypothetical protein